MTKDQYDFIKAEIEREKNASPFYLACRELPENYEELKAEFENYTPPKSWGFSQLYFTKNREELSQLSCKHENIKRSDGCDECMDCGARNY